MPKIINQTGVSVDSLQAKLMLLESKFSKLSAEHKIIQDSLKSLDKTIQKADIGTTFYDTHLATYTAIFGVIVAFLLTIAALINWFGLIKPQEQKFNALVDDLQENLENFKKDHIDAIIDDLKAVSARSLQNIIVSMEATNKDLSFLFSVRLIRLLSDWEGANEDRKKEWYSFTYEYLDETEFDYEQISEVYEEIIESLTFAIKFATEEDDKALLNRILSDFVVKVNSARLEHESQTTLDFQELDGEVQESQD